ncbi:MAG: cobalt-precorrin-5B (C(1))-methyltransferase [Proteobacteria bacterium]|nr:cobalt-precorrin-5B (C(1))-methyltransferase [Pseudomonadota bacterium]
MGKNISQPVPAKEPDKNDNLRTGFTTGACSAAAAKGATRMIVLQRQMKEIESTLPNKDKVLFQLNRRELLNDFTAICSVIKDAGDDPDCTDGAELTVKVELKKTEGVDIEGGKGVAVVTKVGLGLPVGTPAINPVPSKNIREMVLEEIRETPFKGARITISVPGGEEMSKKTINARLGLIGGISILGTRGTVKPFSTSAYRASVIQAVSIAKTSGCKEVIATTGWRTEKAAMALFPGLKEETFIQVGDFIGTSLRAIKKAGIQRAIIVGMMGKLSKMADGVTMTHQSGSMVNMRLLSKLTAESGGSQSLVNEIGNANTARHVLEICHRNNFTALPKMICGKVVASMDNYLNGGLEIQCYLVDFEGSLLAKQI